MFSCFTSRCLKRTTETIIFSRLSYTKQAEREANQPTKKKSAEDSEADLDPTQYTENRIKQVIAQKQRRRASIPHKFHVSLQLKDFIAKYESVTKDGEQLDEEVSLAGRIMNKRASGNSLIFYDLCAEGLKVQVTAEAQAAEEFG